MYKYTIILYYYSLTLSSKFVVSLSQFLIVISLAVTVKWSNLLTSSGIRWPQVHAKHEFTIITLQQADKTKSGQMDNKKPLLSEPNFFYSDQ